MEVCQRRVWSKFILGLWAGRDSSVVLAWVQILRSYVKRQMWRCTPVIPALGVGAGRRWRQADPQSSPATLGSARETTIKTKVEVRWLSKWRSLPLSLIT